MYDHSHIATLLYRQLNGSITPDEEQELRQWSDSSLGRDILVQELQNEDRFAETLQYYHPQHWKMSDDRMKKNIAVVLAQQTDKRVVHRVHFLRRGFLRYAAAVLLLIIGISAYLYYTIENKQEVAQTTPSLIVNDVLPGSDKAILTLSDGSTIKLDGAANGQLAVQKGANIVKDAQGKIVYSAAGSADEMVYNTMSTPRGGQYQIKLPDGTNVWLNAASSITYPTAFIGKTREVKITGEAYFEVTKNRAKPFMVKTEKEMIMVLGTSFNVNSYQDDPQPKISLVEGSIKINQSVLKAGQAYLNGKIVATNINQDIAWKAGFFYFDKADLPTVLRQLSRWYNIEVVYNGKIPFFDFQGKLPKSLNLSQVLKILERMEVRFKIEGQRLIVSP